MFFCFLFWDLGWFGFDDLFSGFGDGLGCYRPLFCGPFNNFCALISRYGRECASLALVADFVPHGGTFDRVLDTGRFDQAVGLRMLKPILMIAEFLETLIFILVEFAFPNLAQRFTDLEPILPPVADLFFEHFIARLFRDRP